MTVTIENSIVLVTGANRGIGKAIVDSFIEHGASKVYAAVRNPSSADPLKDVHGEKVVVLQMDMKEPETIASLAERASDTTIAINNAGILRHAKPLDEKAIELFSEEIEVNVYGLLRFARAVAPVLKQNDGGALVQINSVASLKSFPDFSSYCASKAAAYSFTQALHSQLVEQGTHVLSVHPGPIATDMATEAGLEEIAEPPSVVAEGIITALKEGSYHLFPDSMAREMWQAYQSFASNVVEADSPA